jgi:hypothetical protein
VIEKNTELTIANSDLQKKVVELQDVSEECQTLKSTLVNSNLETFKRLIIILDYFVLGKV